MSLKKCKTIDEVVESFVNGHNGYVKSGCGTEVISHNGVLKCAAPYTEPNRKNKTIVYVAQRYISTAGPIFVVNDFYMPFNGCSWNYIIKRLYNKLYHITYDKNIMQMVIPQGRLDVSKLLSCNYRWSCLNCDITYAAGRRLINFMAQSIERIRWLFPDADENIDSIVQTEFERLVYLAEHTDSIRAKNQIQ